MSDFARQRQTMIESQIRPNRVTDRELIAVMGSLPREMFVPAAKRSLAYIDEALEVWPSIDGAPPRYLLAPMVLARLIQLASVAPEDNVLDVGCATGYSTGLLAKLARSVVGLEPEPELAAAARQTLAELALDNVSIVSGALREGYPPNAPYNVILLNGSVPEVPQSLLAQLAEGGRLVAILSADGARTAVGPGPGKAYLFVNAGGEVSGLPHFDAGAKPLPGFSPAPSFVF